MLIHEIEHLRPCSILHRKKPSSSIFPLLFHSTDVRTILLLESGVHLSLVYRFNLSPDQTWASGAVSGVCVLDCGEVAISAEDWPKTHTGGTENIFERYCNASNLQTS